MIKMYYPFLSKSKKGCILPVLSDDRRNKFHIIWHPHTASVPDNRLVVLQDNNETDFT